MRRIFVLLVLGWPLATAAHVRTGIDEEARLPYWEVVQPGITLRLVQRLPDQTRGFFQARGFSPAHAEIIAQSCVFQTIFRNTSHESTPSAIEYDLKEWVVTHEGRRQRMKVRDDWRTEWQARKAPDKAQIAFEWALFPTVQVYGPGDYNWGMSIFNLKPASRFDLKVVWRQDGRTHQAVITGMLCAPDVHLEPGAL